MSENNKNVDFNDEKEPIDSIEQTVEDLKKKIAELSEEKELEAENNNEAADERMQKIQEIKDATVNTLKNSISDTVNLNGFQSQKADKIMHGWGIKNIKQIVDENHGEMQCACKDGMFDVNIIFMAIFLGYSIGSAPIVSYHYGAENHTELKSMFRKSLILLTVSGVILVVLSELVARPLVMIFTSYDPELLDMTASGFQLYALAFLPMGFNVWGSAFFTALNNGAVSACISFLRTLVFQIIVVLTLPILLDIDGIWLSIVAAELLSLAVTVSFLLVKRKRYQYA